MGGEATERHDQVALSGAEELDEASEAGRVADRDTIVLVGGGGGVHGQRDLAAGLGQELVVDPGAVVLAEREDAEHVVTAEAGVQAKTGDLELHGEESQRLALHRARGTTAGQAETIGEVGA